MSDTRTNQNCNTRRLAAVHGPAARAWPPAASVTHLPAAELHRGDDLLIHTDPLRPEQCQCCHVLAALVHDGVVDVALRGHQVRALTLPAGLLVEVVEHPGPVLTGGGTA